MTSDKWRIIGLAPYRRNGHRIGEVRLFDVDGNYLLTGATATASGDADGHVPQDAIDQIDSSMWATKNGGGKVA